ncbi:tripartite tricarboxylate transporter substrate binding protein [uncultured Ruegeria sp.]|uniref:Bug family tripartite tricarboxylate transporter substrate binding protein n=1 Tax=uncultured Ruegeria sp. TaxID=259304 RepID=UPI0026086F66|nr:tripartite tricarboxylate transporter substrate binding protein [uncultured Ruegeria sp.]
MNMIKTLSAAAMTVLLGASAAVAEWPERPINVIVPFKAGGSSDLVARSFASAIEEQGLLSQPVTVINVGGHSSVGARRVLDAAPDGYEFLLHETGIIGAQASGIIDFGYADYKPVAATGSICMALLTRKDSGYDSLSALLDAARAAPGEIVFGVNLGGLNHMSGILLENSADVKFRFAQIGGSADNFAALTGGQTAVASVGAAGARNFTLTDDGQVSDESQVQTIALLADAPHDRLPNVKTAAEQGSDVQFCFTNYWFAPADTPDDIITAFAGALEAAAGSERIVTFYNDTLSSPVFLKGDDFTQHLEETAAVVGPIAQQATQN